ncbi:hypothetical protein TNCV_4318111 [Trichonephila clavipes]|nr:hypothetical protein TNCV_4318111 [Trichonephila clavipes]
MLKKAIVRMANGIELRTHVNTIDAMFDPVFRRILEATQFGENVKYLHSIPRSPDKGNRWGLNLVNALAMKLNHGIQCTFRNIPCPNTPVQNVHNALSIHLVGIKYSCRC